MKDYAYDIVDERDYSYSELFWNSEYESSDYPEKVILDNCEYQNQGLEDITRNMCVYYSTGHWSNEENYWEGSKVRIDCKELWLKALELWRLDVNKWALVSDWPKTAKDLWFIKWWLKVKNISEIKHSLFNKRPIVVGSKKINWKSWYKKPFVLSGNSWSGHAVLIIWYDDNYEGGCFIIKNSYWKGKYDSWKMYLKYSDFNLLFPSKYSLIDKEDDLLLLKKKIMAKINIPMARAWYELGLWNWERPDAPATREEIVTIILRAIQKGIDKRDIEEILSKQKN